MAVRLYMDVHVPRAIADQLRRRGVDVLTAIEDAADQLPDDQLLERATELGRAIFTQDIRFKALAEQWQREQRDFAGLLFGPQLGVTIGQYVRDLELIAKACDREDCRNVVQHLPL
jgi:transcriptional regulator GlxA family with amidase domain